MPEVIQFQPHLQECRFVEVLTSRDAARTHGYRLGGARPGPLLVVAGHAPVSERVFDRLLALPTLPWLRGQLVLLSLESLDECPRGGAFAEIVEAPPDEILFLPYVSQPEFADEAERQGYRTVLRLCSKYGMIDGRGVH